MWEAIAGIAGIIMLGFFLYDRYKKRIKSWRKRCGIFRPHKWEDVVYYSESTDLADMMANPSNYPKKKCLRCGMSH